MAATVFELMGYQPPPHVQPSLLAPVGAAGNVVAAPGLAATATA